DTKKQSRLYCYYKMDRPYLRLAPFKVEIVRQNSLVALVYDIVSNEEARIIKMLALPQACLLLLVLYCGINTSRGIKGKRKRMITVSTLDLVESA
ncbi:unnamed protein product, partial [Onchocerca ochengi]|uniref:Ovule protein n=1 Tax=Onchocerca ochengi TaxID=42157 RepID=A0A182EYE6_ONCOC